MTARPAPVPTMPRPPEAVFEAARRIARAAAYRHVRATQAAASSGQGDTAWPNPTS